MNNTGVPDDIYELYNDKIAHKIDKELNQEILTLLEAQYGMFLAQLINREWQLYNKSEEILTFEAEHGNSLALIIENASQKQQLKEINEKLTEEIEIRKKKEEEILKITKELEKANTKLKNLSLIDGLTGIQNRRHFDETLEREWFRCLRNVIPLSLIMIDIDFFKQYNDTYGHLGGDTCLKSVAAALKKAIRRSSDFLARYGGEEFSAILPNTDIDGVTSVAQQMKQFVMDLKIPHEKSQAHDNVTISLGIATVKPDKSMSYSDLIHKADEALYLAKKNGRNQVFIAE